ncbi:MAG: hypothetical protein PF448_12990 [Bacteroidales bacterium]|jgi:hypothetical protein|nr:hypothetical protein [Bacteroidales bacterium]
MKKVQYFYPETITKEAAMVNMSGETLDEYTDKVCKFINELPEGRQQKIEDVANKRTLNLFIEISKLFHDEIGGVNFTQNFTHINKLISYE